MARVNRILRNLFKAGTGGVGVLGAALGLCGVCSGQVIRLNAQTQVARQQDVRLGDIALVTATDPKTTEELASTVIVTGVEHSENDQGRDSAVCAPGTARCSGGGRQSADQRSGGVRDQGAGESGNQAAPETGGERGNRKRDRVGQGRCSNAAAAGFCGRQHATGHAERRTRDDAGGRRCANADEPHPGPGGTRAQCRTGRCPGEL